MRVLAGVRQMNYRYGFNGKEKDDEVKGSGNHVDYGFRVQDTRLARFLSVDPLTKQFPMLTPYQFASLNPILNIDLDGLEGYNYNGEWIKKGKGKTAIAISKDKYDRIKSGEEEPDPEKNYIYSPFDPSGETNPDHQPTYGYGPWGPGYWYMEDKNDPEVKHPPKVDPASPTGESGGSKENDPGTDTWDDWLDRLNQQGESIDLNNPNGGTVPYETPKPNEDATGAPAPSDPEEENTSP